MNIEKRLKIKICNTCGYRGYKFFSSRQNKCKKCLATQQRAYRKTRPVSYWKNKDREYTIRHRYGLSVEEYKKMFERQGGKCGICDRKPSMITDTPTQHRTLQIDHNHNNGKIRGLLCNGCNRALGFIRDNPNIARSMTVYLENHK